MFTRINSAIALATVDKCHELKLTIDKQIFISISAPISTIADKFYLTYKLLISYIYALRLCFTSNNKLQLLDI